ncbi:MaoC family dehydratase [Halopenitus sp. H-Gu1]|uniref:MaoC family dehydratase n=1 Tax=Halopenitus sp. H-Gu1 TaxID=3242697 RepID=UPI00359D7821
MSDNSSRSARYFEELEVGESAAFENARTITGADIANFAGVSGDFHPIHMSSEFAREETQFDGRIAHGQLISDVTESIAADENRHAFSYGHDETRFVKPVYPGDTLSPRRELVEKEVYDEDYGRVVYEYETTNQDGEVVFVDRHTMLVKRRP